MLPCSKVSYMFIYIDKTSGLRHLNMRELTSSISRSRVRSRVKASAHHVAYWLVVELPDRDVIVQLVRVQERVTDSEITGRCAR